MSTTTETTKTALCSDVTKVHGGFMFRVWSVAPGETRRVRALGQAPTKKEANEAVKAWIHRLESK